jgi:acylphosphatase
VNLMERITVIRSGKIRNVGYRARVVGIAKEFGITGTVQNLTDGRVKIIADGEERDLKGFLDAISIKNALINVEDVEVKYSDATREYNDFYKLVFDVVVWVAKCSLTMFYMFVVTKVHRTIPS